MNVAVKSTQRPKGDFEAGPDVNLPRNKTKML
jgi:hypothetical protein